MTRKDKIRKIADHYGTANQARRTIQKCAELIVVLSSYLEYRAFRSDDRGNGNYLCCVDDMNAKIADVKIAIRQMEYLFGTKSEINNYLDFQLDGQLDKIAHEDSDS